MSENTKLWDILGRTDPKATKGFTRGGGFKGTAIKPMWSYRRMTEEFGPCGTGWGIDKPEFQVSEAGGEKLVFCVVSVWYGNRDQVCWGVGGDRIVAQFKDGNTKADDEAFKKAFTDAVTNALKMIGVGADVHMGMFDDSKYVNAVRQEFADEQSDRRVTDEGQTNGQKRVVGINPKTGMRTAHSLKKDTGPDTWGAFQDELLECQTVGSLGKLAMAWSSIAERDKWPEEWRNLAKEEINKRKDVIVNGPAEQSDFPGDPGYVPPREQSVLEAG